MFSFLIKYCRAPRFLLKQAQYKKPEENYLYQNLKQVKAQDNSVNPSPHTATLLPLRPKSCMPRIHHSVSLQVILGAILMDRWL